MAVVRVEVRLMRKVGWYESAVHDSVYPAHAVHHSISQLLCGDVVLWSTTSQWRSWSRSWSSQLLCNASVARKCRAPIDQHCRRRYGDDFQRRNDVINALVKRRRPLRSAAAVGRFVRICCSLGRDDSWPMHRAKGCGTSGGGKVKKVKSKRSIAVSDSPHRYGNSHATWDHTALPATRQRRHSRRYPSRSWYSIKRPRRDARLS